MLFAPSARHGDLTEYKHRHFIFVYILTAIFTVTYLLRLCQSSINTKKFKVISYIFTAQLLGLTIFSHWNKNPAEPNLQAMPWAIQLHNQSISPGLIEVSSFIKTHSTLGDVFILDPSLQNTPLSNQAIQLISLSGVPAFLSRTTFMEGIRTECVRNLINHRIKIYDSLLNTSNWESAGRLMVENGARWFIAPSKKQVPWDPMQNLTSFKNGSYVVYDFYDANLAKSINFYKTPICN